MSIATFSSKGQITLPVQMRRTLGIKAKDRVAIETSGDAIIIKPVIDFFELKGFLRKGLSMNEEKRQMKKAVAKRVMEGLK